MAPLLSGLAAGLLPASILVLAGARGGGCRTALVPRPRWGGGLKGTVGREGRISGEEEEEEDGVSLPMLTTNVLWAEDLFLQPSTADAVLLRGKAWSGSAAPRGERVSSLACAADGRASRAEPSAPSAATGAGNQSWLRVYP